MSTDKPNPPKRRIVVRVTSRDKHDPVALLNAVKNALSGHGRVHALSSALIPCSTLSK